MIYLIGIGPGDPELLTVKAVRLIGQAHVVYVPQSREDGRSVAIKIIAPYADTAKIHMVHVPMRSDRSDVLGKYRALAATMAERAQEGQSQVFVTLGDPMLYSTAQYLAQELENLGLPYEYVPGIPSFVAAASHTRMPLAAQRESCAVITMPEEVDQLAQWAAQHDVLVIMKINKKMPVLLEYVKKYAPQTALLAHRLGMGDGEEVFELTKETGMPEGVGYLSTAIVRQKKND